MCRRRHGDDNARFLFLFDNDNRAPELLPLAYDSLKTNGIHDMFIVGLVIGVPITIGMLFVVFVEFFIVPEKPHRA